MIGRCSGPGCRMTSVPTAVPCGRSIAAPVFGDSFLTLAVDMSVIGISSFDSIFQIVIVFFCFAVLALVCGCIICMIGERLFERIIRYFRFSAVVIPTEGFIENISSVRVSDLAGSLQLLGHVLVLDFIVACLIFCWTHRSLGLGNIGSLVGLGFGARLILTGCRRLSILGCSLTRLRI